MPDTKALTAGREQRALPSSTWPEVASWCLAAAALLAVLSLHLLPALLAGFVVYELVHIIAPYLQRRLSGQRSRVAAVVLLAAIVVGILAAAVFGATAFFHMGA